jgi:lipopolysaccharide export system protein LptA
VNPSEPNRVSTSQTVDANFLAQGGIDSITQRGNVFYSDDQTPDKRMQAAAEFARYTPGDQVLVLTGNPRVTNGNMATTARTIRLNRATGDAIADTDVKSTYSELKDQPDGALLASSSPIHVTAHTMTAHSNPGVALYSGNARLWQDANVIEAPSIQFEREHRFVVAQGTQDQPVSTTLVQAAKPSLEKDGKDKAKDGNKGSRSAQSSPIAITGRRLTYADEERKAHYEGGVLARGADFTASAKTVDAYLLPHSQTPLRGQTSGSQSLGGISPAGPGQLDHLVAQGHVVIQQPARRAEGETLTYGAAEDKFVLTGGSPSIFDAERGKTTGNSLTFFRRDDRVLVEGEASTPVVTQTRVAR